MFHVEHCSVVEMCVLFFYSPPRHKGTKRSVLVLCALHLRGKDLNPCDDEFDSAIALTGLFRVIDS
jgi:hypothetical protein